MKITIDNNLWVKVYSEKGGSVETQKVEAHLLFLILEELKKINSDREGRGIIGESEN